MVTPTFWLLNFFTGGRLGHTGDAGIGNHALHPGAAGVAQLADKRGGGFRHVHGLRFQRLADPMRRPSITGRIPIFGKLIFHYRSSGYADNRFSSSPLVNGNGQNKDDGEAQRRDQFGGRDIAGGVADKAITGVTIRRR